MDERLFFSATKRNTDHISNVLTRLLPKSGFVLEIASGSGEHAVSFQERFPNICWQTSDPDPFCRKSIRAWIKHKSFLIKMPSPIDLDVLNHPWPLTSELRNKLKGIVCINMLHISPWECTVALFEEAGNLLKKDQFLMIYGPFKVNGEHTSGSNFRFDESLKTRNPNWGIRDFEFVNEIGTKYGFKKGYSIKMPANNLSLIFKKNSL